MAAFMTDLMNSIFTPGPTSSLILATNVSFACLQVTLFALLVATYSIHFVILSIICGGLWAAINWFVQELQAHEAQQKQKEAAQPKGDADSSSESDTDAQTVVDEIKDSGSKEVEVLPPAPGLTERGKEKDSQAGSEIKGSEVSTEDEWEKVSETEKDK